MDRNNKCSACNIKLDEDNYKKDRNECKKCYKKKNEKIPPKSKIKHQKSIILLLTVTIERFWLVIFFQKVLSRVENSQIPHDGDKYIITKPPP